MCTCTFECDRLDFQIPAPLYEALALEGLTHSPDDFLHSHKEMDE